MKIIKIVKSSRIKGVCYSPGDVVELSEYVAKEVCGDGIGVPHEPEKDEHIFRTKKKKSVEKTDKE